MSSPDQRIQDIKEVSLAIDDWDDIFSDFDPRPLSDRTLSEDFIAELKKRYRETRTGTFQINMFAPQALKNEKSEKMVTQRLKKYFKHRLLSRQKERGRIRMRGIIFVSLGICFSRIFDACDIFSLL